MQIKPQRLIQELSYATNMLNSPDCRCSTLNANNLSSYSMCDNMSFNNRSILNVCHLSFHICFQKHISPRQNFDEWVIVAPKLKIFSCFDVLPEGRGQRWEIQSGFPRKQASGLCRVGGLTARLLRVPLKCLHAMRGDPRMCQNH